MPAENNRKFYDFTVMTFFFNFQSLGTVRSVGNFFVFGIRTHFVQVSVFFIRPSDVKEFPNS